MTPAILARVASRRLAALQLADAAIAAADLALCESHRCTFYCCPACHEHMLSDAHMAKGACP